MLNLYLRPKHEKHILGKLKQAIPQRLKQETTVLLGDLNTYRQHEAWLELLSDLQLHDVSNADGVVMLTHDGNTHWSALDVACVSAELLDISGWTANLTITPRADNAKGHAVLSMDLRPPRAPHTSGLDKYSRAPDSTFT